jgi:hypothetical protein
MFMAFIMSSAGNAMFQWKLTRCQGDSLSPPRQLCTDIYFRFEGDTPQTECAASVGKDVVSASQPNLY